MLKKNRLSVVRVITWILNSVRRAINSTVHTTLQASPMQLVFGRDAFLPVSFQDIPSFEDKPLAFWLLEFYGAVFIYLCNAVRTSTYVAPMFSVWVNEDQDLIV